MRDRPLRLEGESAILEEIRPEFFPFVIKWRNDKSLNRYLNHPEDLTPEAEEKWYRERYLKDHTQGLLIIIDKSTGTPFGTQGWTDYDSARRQCIEGRLLLGDSSYGNSLPFLESFFLMDDYLYQYVDVIYSHVVLENEASLKINNVVGFMPHDAWEYPEERFVQGMEQAEFYRTREMYEAVKERLFGRMGVGRWPLMKGSRATGEGI